MDFSFSNPTQPNVDEAGLMDHDENAQNIQNTRSQARTSRAKKPSPKAKDNTEQENVQPAPGARKRTRGEYSPTDGDLIREIRAEFK